MKIQKAYVERFFCFDLFCFNQMHSLKGQAKQQHMPAVVYIKTSS